jgi:signal transduction histidine kinase
VARARHDWQAAHAHAQAWGLHEQHQAEQQRQVILRDMESAHAQALQLLPEVLRGPLLDILDTVRAASAAPGGPELPRIQEVARHALHAADRGLQRARALLDPLLAPGTVDLAEAADDAVACLGAQAQAAHLLLQLQLDPPAWVRAPRGLLHAGLVHLLGLAMQRTPPGGQVSLRIQADTAFTWHVQLLDQGPGRGASARAPAGPVPGLVFIERMVHRLGGSLRAGDDPEGGGLVELWLPAVSAPDP